MNQELIFRSLLNVNSRSSLHELRSCDCIYDRPGYCFTTLMHVSKALTTQISSSDRFCRSTFSENLRTKKPKMNSPQSSIHFSTCLAINSKYRPANSSWAVGQ